jgi:hypothetical protein
MVWVPLGLPGLCLLFWVVEETVFFLEFTWLHFVDWLSYFILIICPDLLFEIIVFLFQIHEPFRRLLFCHVLFLSIDGYTIILDLFFGGYINWRLYFSLRHSLRPIIRKLAMTDLISHIWGVEVEHPALHHNTITLFVSLLSRSVFFYNNWLTRHTEQLFWLGLSTHLSLGLLLSGCESFGMVTDIPCCLFFLFFVTYWTIVLRLNWILGILTEKFSANHIWFWRTQVWTIAKFLLHFLSWVWNRSMD